MPARIPLSPHGRTLVIAVGKGAAEMMRVAQARGGAVEGLVVTRHGHLPADVNTLRNVEIIEAGHPYPDQNSLRAAHRALELAGTLKTGDRMLVLLSGGGSALLAAPVAGLDTRGQAGRDARLAAIGRDDRGNQSRPQASVG